MTTELISQIDSILHLDAKDKLVPHGIGGLARQLLEACKAELNTRATPDVPELVRYGCGANVLGLYIEPMADGQYVRHDQAAEMIAAKVSEVSEELSNNYMFRLDAMMQPLRNAIQRWKSRAEAAEAKLAEHVAARQSYANLFDGDVGSIHENIRTPKDKLAKINDQNPVTWLHSHTVEGNEYHDSPLTDFDKRQGWTETPLYAAPVANNPPKINVNFQCKSNCITGTQSADVINVSVEDDGSYTAAIDHWPVASEAETIERLREALKFIAEEGHQYISEDLIRHATDALSGKEPS